ncbi:MAG: DUF86 domain-containing protein [Thermodesulfobacteriota bacterium]
MPPEDKVRIQHMIDAGEEALRFAQGRQRSDLDKDRMLVLALIKDVEIIGEAASKVTEKVKEAHPEIPWLSIIGMRNRLIHAYFDINLDVLWRTIQEDLPPLIKHLTHILGSIS